MAQTEELLLKRQGLLEKKVAQETEKAKEFSKLKNKRGMPLNPLPIPPQYPQTCEGGHQASLPHWLILTELNEPRCSITQNLKFFLHPNPLPNPH